MSKKEKILGTLKAAKYAYTLLQEKQEKIYQETLKSLGIEDDEHSSIFDYLANDFLSDRQAVAYVKLARAKHELNEANEEARVLYAARNSE